MNEQGSRFGLGIGGKSATAIPRLTKHVGLVRRYRCVRPMRRQQIFCRTSAPRMTTTIPRFSMTEAVGCGWLWKSGTAPSWFPQWSTGSLAQIFPESRLRRLNRRVCDNHGGCQPLEKLGRASAQCRNRTFQGNEFLRLALAFHNYWQRPNAAHHRGPSRPSDGFDCIGGDAAASMKDICLDPLISKAWITGLKNLPTKST